MSTSETNKGIVLYILFIWFVISFVTNIIGPLLPLFISDFHLSLALAGFLPFSFFLAYGIASIPAGLMIERAGVKASMLVALSVNCVGALVFSLIPGFYAALLALFVMGLGMAMLQVVINPLMRTAGGESHFAFYSVLAQLVFGLASFASPYAFTALMVQGNSALFQMVKGPHWIAFYWIFAAIFILCLALTQAMRMPTVALKADERVEGWNVYAKLARQPRTWLFFAGIAAYVGTEQGLANWMSQFLANYHGLSPLGEGAATIGRFWGAMAAGCAVGLVLLKLMDSRLLLCLFTAAAIACVLAALFGTASTALMAFPAAGFFLSVMFSTVFSLALNSVDTHHGAFSGILCSGLVGGAVSPLVIGVFGNALGLRSAMLLVVATLAYIFFVGVVARPLIVNATIRRAQTS